ncbi:hypothetical protein E2562_014623 [Oryza meyeriana var. granulata]|uniref:Uncharacterized protein n=1 Tax=Oryza meyeriana var. granulata TaxID=110450 RepID=A0A6G1DXQ7_9ORYZ|nr:hypothetical protein E2562_014623 [Oryza meyeriana var. granulata]
MGITEGATALHCPPPLLRRREGPTVGVPLPLLLAAQPGAPRARPPSQPLRRIQSHGVFGVLRCKKANGVEALSLTLSPTIPFVPYDLVGRMGMGGGVSSLEAAKERRGGQRGGRKGSGRCGEAAGVEEEDGEHLH